MRFSVLMRDNRPEKRFFSLRGEPLSEPTALAAGEPMHDSAFPWIHPTLARTAQLMLNGEIQNI